MALYSEICSARPGDGARKVRDERSKKWIFSPENKHKYISGYIDLNLAMSCPTVRLLQVDRVKNYNYTIP